MSPIAILLLARNGQREQGLEQRQLTAQADPSLHSQMIRLEGNTGRLTQKLIAELYGVSAKTVNEHLVNIYCEAELPPEVTIRSFRSFPIVQREGRLDVARNVEHYSLDAILAVGYRVHSPAALRFVNGPQRVGQFTCATGSSSSTTY